MLHERPRPTWTPRFGERLLNVFAGAKNPHRIATFVRTRKMNRKTVWEMTDERGAFWCMDPRAMERFSEPIERATKQALTPIAPDAHRDPKSVP